MRYIVTLLSVLTFAFTVRQEQEQQPESRKVSESVVIYRGRKMSAAKFAEGCRQVDSEKLRRSRRPMIGFGVTAKGLLSQIQRDQIVVLTKATDEGWEQPLKIDATNIKELPHRRELIIQVWGIAKSRGEVEGWFWALEPPELKWQYELLDPGTVSGQYQTFHVACLVRNTGRQAIRSVSGIVRLWQEDSPNDWTEQFTLKDLSPGESRQFTVEFTIYNYQYIAPTSIPKVSMQVVDYEL